MLGEKIARVFALVAKCWRSCHTALGKLGARCAVGATNLAAQPTITDACVTAWIIESQGECVVSLVIPEGLRLADGDDVIQRCYCGRLEGVVVLGRTLERSCGHNSSHAICD